MEHNHERYYFASNKYDGVDSAIQVKLTNEIKEKLDNLGYEASLRTIQETYKNSRECFRLFVTNAAILLAGAGNMMLEGMSLLQWIQFKR